ncbi:MAG: penicillin-binding protein 1C [Sulfitobacter sp.]
MIRRFGLLVLAAGLLLAAGLRDGFDGWIERTEIPAVLAETSVEMRGHDGQLMRVFPVENGRIRMGLALSEVDPDFLDMLIAYEDKRFYRHGGVDLLALVRAAGQAAFSGQVSSGGSTLTMQAGRLIENSGTGRWPGKLRQIRLALALERRLSKAQILELYLAHAPYGGRIEGLRAGSWAWFGKEPKRLSAAQAALLVALPQSPETRRPDRHPDVAKAARDRVLARTGRGAGDGAEAVPRSMAHVPMLAPHLADRLKAAHPGRSRLDVHLDAGLQRAAEALLRRAVRGQMPGVSAAIVIADHETGVMRATAGSPAYSAAGGRPGFVDMTAALRSPGSTLKPLIYGLAFDQGLAHPDMVIMDAPVAFGRYAPQNFDGGFRGEITLREALRQSLNIPPVLLTHELGPARLMAAMRRGGATPVVPGGKPGLAVALGGVGITLRDLVQLYAGIAQGGQAQMLRADALAPQMPAGRIMSPVAAWQVSDILAGISPPAGFGAAAGKIAYKTGTSYGHRDAWAVGFDGQHVIGVWLGRPDGTPVPGAFGGDLAAPILFEAFGRIGAPRRPLPVPPPDTLILGTAELPLPLQRFRRRGAAFEVAAPDHPTVAFPPDGAVLRSAAHGVPLKLRAGALPFTVLINGAPVVTGLNGHDALLPLPGRGFNTIAVIDAKGRAARVTVKLD